MTNTGSLETKQVYVVSDHFPPLACFCPLVSSVTVIDDIGKERHFFVGGQFEEFEGDGNHDEMYVSKHSIAVL